MKSTEILHFVISLEIVINRVSKPK
jgi:hypothetical protein